MKDRFFEINGKKIVINKNMKNIKKLLNLLFNKN